MLDESGRCGAQSAPISYALSTETLTFLFTDIEGSTGLLERLGEGTYADVLAEHHRVIRAGLAAHDGKEVGTQGDGFFADERTRDGRGVPLSSLIGYKASL